MRSLICSDASSNGTLACSIVTDNLDFKLGIFSVFLFGCQKYGFSDRAIAYSNLGIAREGFPVPLANLTHFNWPIVPQVIEDAWSPKLW